MNETIELMKAHTSVRRFTEEQISDEELRAIIDAGRAASSWKNFQSYSVKWCAARRKKRLFLTWFRRKRFFRHQPFCSL